MNGSQIIILLLLGALWGASFLFMRVAAPEIGVVWLTELRVLLAGLVLLPWLLWRRRWVLMRSHARDLFVVGALNSALPFMLVAYITTSVAAGVSSILNAIVPIVGVVFAYFFASEKLTWPQLMGVASGFFGVMVLMLWRQAEILSPSPLMVSAALAASISYVAGAHYTKQRLAQIPSITFVIGTQLAAAILLLPLLPFFVPQQYPGVEVVGSIIGLAVLSTSLAFVWYFKLIHQVGPTKTLMVTYLVPFFGMLWGALFLDEVISMNQIAGGILILTGVTLSLNNFGHKSVAKS